MHLQISAMCSARKLPASRGTTRVLVVDDYRDGAEATTLYLRALGFEAHFVTDARDVQRAFAQHMPEAVLLDIRMPEMDGFEVAGVLRASPDSAEAVIIAYTSMPWPDIEASAIAAGFDGYFRKASDMSELPRLLGAYREAPQMAG